MANMNDVAREAGVSRYTVSKVLNGGRVSPKTREKILAACDKLHYRRNLHALSLVRNESRTIGMVISQNYDSFFGEIISAAEQQARAADYQLICQCSYGHAEEEAAIINNFESLQVCGVIAAPVLTDPNTELWASLEKRVPVVHFDCYLKKECHYVINDNFRSAQLATEHLLSSGRVPAYLGSAHPEVNLAIKNRNRGYAETVEASGHEPIFIPTDNSTQTSDNQAFGYENMSAYLEQESLPEALFCVTDRVAMGAIRALYERGHVVGRDIFVVGHDDLSLGRYMTPSLTSVAQHKTEMGRQCVEAIFQLIQTPDSEEKLQRVLTPELIVRESSVAAQA